MLIVFDVLITDEANRSDKQFGVQINNEHKNAPFSGA